MKAADRLGERYARFAVSNKLLMCVSEAAFVALLWIFVSKTLAILSIALWVILGLYGLATERWRRRTAGQ